MDALGDGLECLDVPRRRAAVVAVVVSDVATVEGHARRRRRPPGADGGDDGLGVKGIDGRVDVDVVGVEQARVVERGEDGGGERRARVEGRLVWRLVPSDLCCSSASARVCGGRAG